MTPRERRAKELVFLLWVGGILYRVKMVQSGGKVSSKRGGRK